jgi:3',5'-cyclic AMP phosphodiesterase CpdA
VCKHLSFALILVSAFLGLAHADQFKFPLKPNSVRFAAIGDMGTGEKPQYQIAQQMISVRQAFPFDFVIMLGDNIYGGSAPKDFEKKFEEPYKPLLDAGVKFYASLGNHDNPNERLYKFFNMNGSNYYTFKKGNVRFFALDSNYMDSGQLTWLEKQLKDAGNKDWKICFFHHTLYSTAKAHGSAVELRSLLEPMFIRYGVDAVFAGHDHVYERIHPQGGIYYFTEGSSGELRTGDLKRTSIEEKGFDVDRTFMVIEISGNEMYFETLSRVGNLIDSGTLPRVARPAEEFSGNQRNRVASKPCACIYLISAAASKAKVEVGHPSSVLGVRMALISRFEAIDGPFRRRLRVTVPCCKLSSDPISHSSIPNITTFRFNIAIKKISR